MKAIQFDRYGDPFDVLKLRDLPLLEPGEGEVSVQMLLSPINPSDLLFIRGLYPGIHPSFPASVGFEGVGRIDRIGAHVEGFVVGQRVVVANNDGGGNWAEYVVCPARLLVPIPESLPDEQAASLLVNPMTALALLRSVLSVPKGAWLVQSAANSELGKMIIRLAKHDGIRTINVVRSQETAAELVQLGADAVITPTDGPLDEQVRAIIGNQGVSYALDAVLGDIGTQLFEALADDGHMVVYGYLSGEPLQVGVHPRTVLTGNRTLQGHYTSYWIKKLDQATLAEFSRDLIQLVEEKVLTTTPGPTYPLAAFSDAIRQTEEHGRRGKVYLRLVDPV